MMLAYRLVRLIENHSEQLASTLLERIKISQRTNQYVAKVPPDDLKERVFEIYHHLGQWLLTKSEADIEQYYGLETGARRAQQGMPLSQVIWAIFLIRDNLIAFLQNDVQRNEQTTEVFSELELTQLLDQFFERAVYYAAVGYEEHQKKAEAWAPATPRQ